VEGDEEMNDLSMNNPKTKLMVWLIIFILIGGAFYWFLIKPQFVQINEFEKQISVKQQKLADLKLARQREKVLLAENKQFQDILPIFLHTNKCHLWLQHQHLQLEI
jgi:Tfp pilus assembly protein PilO